MTLLEHPGLTIGRRIKIARVAAGLEQQQLAEAVGVRRNTMSNWESGRTEPSASHFVRLARIVGQPLDWFAEGVAETPASGAGGGVARPEGFEPPTFWSVAALAALLLVAMRERVAR